MRKGPLFIVIALVLLALAGMIFVLSSVPAKDRSLQLSIVYRAGEDAFVVRLRNQGHRRIQAEVNSDEYRGSIWIVDARGGRKEYFVESFLRTLQTGITGGPTIIMNRNALVTWTIPRGDLRDIHDHTPTLADLDGSTVFAESRMFYAIPDGRNYIRSSEIKCRTGHRP